MFDELMHATQIALQRHSVFVTNNGPTPPTPYVYPSDWINIDDAPAGSIQFLFADTTLATYALLGTTHSGQYTVDWGDGTILSYNSEEVAQHTYTIGSGTPCSRGYTTFKVRVTGNLSELGFVEHGLSSYPEILGVLASVINCDTLISTSMMFGWGPRLYIFEYSKCISAIGVLDAYAMFAGNNRLEFVDISGLSSVTSASDMFSQCTYLQSVDISSLSLITDASYMFSSCYSLKSVDISSLSLVTDASDMFSLCYSLESINLSNMTLLTNTHDMFSRCTSLQSVEVSSLSLVTDASEMFYGCYSLKSVDISSMTLATDVYYMFYDCSSLHSVTIGNLPSVTDARMMFLGCSTLQSINISGMTSLIMADYMFHGCFSLYSVTIGNLPSVTDANSMFYRCESLRSVDISGMTSVAEARYMFYDCSLLSELNGLNFGLNAASTNLYAAFVEAELVKHINLPNTKISAISAYGKSWSPNRLETIAFHPSSPFNGATVPFDIRYNTLTADQLNAIFTSLPTVSGKTIDIRYNPGIATCNQSIATSKGWMVRTS